MLLAPLRASQSGTALPLFRGDFHHHSICDPGEVFIRPFRSLFPLPHTQNNPLPTERVYDELDTSVFTIEQVSYTHD